MNIMMIVLVVALGVLFLTFGILYLFKRSIFSPIGYTNLPEDEKKSSYTVSIILGGTGFLILGMALIIAALTNVISLLISICIGMTIGFIVFALVFQYVKKTTKKVKHRDIKAEERKPRDGSCF